ncbi:MAG: hypothetical protein DRP64_02120 [Verrucomicrobia bacterium]|nr:MAG: hypothetical protein DRP64_02120 [Verrucomicrobiota bacterium]RLA46290.1 MAG: hypothetical protein DRQ97_08090 [Gammaproteobacteria bacterium]
MSGQWSNGANGSETLNTDNGGWVTFTKNNLKAVVSRVTFSVSGITHASLSYDDSTNSDSEGDSDGSSIDVLKDAPPPPANEPPVVTIISPDDQAVFAERTVISLSASATDVENVDETLVITWYVNDDEVGTGTTLDHDFDVDSYTISASVTDSGNASASDSISITVGDVPSATEARIAGLVDDSTAGSRRWTAVATVSVVDNTGQLVQGAVVSGSWSAGAKGGASCTTDALGQCDLSKGNLKLNVNSVTLTITGVSAAGLGFDVSGPSVIELDPVPVPVP